MRGTQLTRLVSKLRAELGRSTNVSVGVDDAQVLMSFLQRTQETLYEDYDWPHLRQVFPAIPLMAGQRYYDLPTDLNYDRIEEVVVRQGTMPVPFPRGIDFDCYAAFDSDAGIRSSPAQRWDIRSVGGVEQIEVWPIPSDSANSMQFKGIRKLAPFVDGNDVCEIDDLLLVLFSAAELLAKDESPAASMKLKAAQQLYSRLKGRSAGARETIRLGMGSPSPQPFRATVSISGR